MYVFFKLLFIYKNLVWSHIQVKINFLDLLKKLGMTIGPNPPDPVPNLAGEIVLTGDEENPEF
jgi:hypothetical protein